MLTDLFPLWLGIIALAGAVWVFISHHTHEWGEWRPGSYSRPGYSTPGEGRVCVRCGKVEHRAG